MAHSLLENFIVLFELVLVTPIISADNLGIIYSAFERACAVLKIAFVFTAAAIFFGAVSERIKLTSFLVFTICLTGLVYPRIGMWSIAIGGLSIAFLDKLKQGDSFAVTFHFLHLDRSAFVTFPELELELEYKETLYIPFLTYERQPGSHGTTGRYFARTERLRTTHKLHAEPDGSYTLVLAKVPLGIPSLGRYRLQSLSIGAFTVAFKSKPGIYLIRNGQWTAYFSNAQPAPDPRTPDLWVQDDQVKARVFPLMGNGLLLSRHLRSLNLTLDYRRAVNLTENNLWLEEEFGWHSTYDSGSNHFPSAGFRKDSLLRVVVGQPTPLAVEGSHRIIVSTHPGERYHQLARPKTRQPSPDLRLEGFVLEAAALAQLTDLQTRPLLSVSEYQALKATASKNVTVTVGAIHPVPGSPYRGRPDHAQRIEVTASEPVPVPALLAIAGFEPSDSFVGIAFLDFEAHLATEEDPFEDSERRPAYPPNFYVVWDVLSKFQWSKDSEGRLKHTSGSWWDTDQDVLILNPGAQVALPLGISSSIPLKEPPKGTVPAFLVPAGQFIRNMPGFQVSLTVQEQWDRLQALKIPADPFRVTWQDRSDASGTFWLVEIEALALEEIRKSNLELTGDWMLCLGIRSQEKSHLMSFKAFRLRLSPL